MAAGGGRNKKTRFRHNHLLSYILMLGLSPEGFVLSEVRRKSFQQFLSYFNVTMEVWIQMLFLLI